MSPYCRPSGTTPTPDRSTRQEGGTFIAATLAHFRNTITTVNKEQRGQVAIFTKTHKQGHSKYGPWDSGNDEKANVDRLVFVTKAADTGGIQSSQPGAMFQHILTDTTKRMTALSHGHTLMAAAAMAAQDRHAGAKFLEPRHHHHWQTTDEFNHGNTADGTAIGRAGPHYTTTRAATGPNKATSVLVRQRPRVRLLTIGQVPAGIR